MEAGWTAETLAEAMAPPSTPPSTPRPGPAGPAHPAGAGSPGVAGAPRPPRTSRAGRAGSWRANPRGRDDVDGPLVALRHLGPRAPCQGCLTGPAEVKIRTGHAVNEGRTTTWQTETTSSLGRRRPCAVWRREQAGCWLLQRGRRRDLELRKDKNVLDDNQPCALAAVQGEVRPAGEEVLGSRAVRGGTAAAAGPPGGGQPDGTCLSFAPATAAARLSGGGPRHLRAPAKAPPKVGPRVRAPGTRRARPVRGRLRRARGRDADHRGRHQQPGHRGLPGAGVDPLVAGAGRGHRRLPQPSRMASSGTTRATSSTSAPRGEGYLRPCRARTCTVVRSPFVSHAGRWLTSLPEEHPPAPPGGVHRLPARPVPPAPRPAPRPLSGTSRRCSSPASGSRSRRKFLIPKREALRHPARRWTATRWGALPHADLDDIVRNMKAADNATYNATFTHPAGAPSSTSTPSTGSARAVGRRGGGGHRPGAEVGPHRRLGSTATGGW